MNQITTTTPQAKQLAPLDKLGEQLRKMREQFQSSLPRHMPVDRFTRWALTAITKSEIKKIADTPAGRRSIMQACLEAASKGVLLDGKEAALVAYGSTCSLNVMVAGIQKLARNSGQISKIVCQVVYENDEFAIDYVADGAPITHKPNLEERGKVKGVYAIVKLIDGDWTQPEWMTVAQVEHIRKTFSKQPNGPMWTKSWDEAARKTVLRRAAKYWPSSTDREADIIDLINTGEDTFIDGHAVENLDAPSTARRIDAPAKKTASEVLQDVEDDAPDGDDQQDDAQDQGHDAETGEVIEPDDKRGATAKVIEAKPLSDDDL